jgi:cell division protein FtsB
MDTSLIIALLGVVSSIAGFLLGRRRRHAEVVGQELSNMQKAIQVWKEVAEYQTTEIATLRREINDLKKEMYGMEQMYRERFCQTCTNLNQ